MESPLFGGLSLFYVFSPLIEIYPREGVIEGRGTSSPSYKSIPLSLEGGGTKGVRVINNRLFPLNLGLSLFTFRAQVAFQIVQLGH